MRHGTIVVVLGAMLAIAACGLGDRRRRHADGDWSRRHTFDRVDQALDRLEATDTQRTRARAILGKTLTDLEPWPEAERRLRADLVAAWRTDTPDRHGLHRRVDAEIESMRALSHALIDDGLELHGVLRSEQREALVRDARAWWR